MDALAAVVAQAPVIRDWRRNVASTVLVLTIGSLLIAGGADWSYRGMRNWAHHRVNTNITLPLTRWQLEVRMRWVEAQPLQPTNITELFDAHPIKSKLYSVALLCSPRWALLWAWLFDREPGLRLLHEHIAKHQAHLLDAVRRAAATLAPDLLPEALLDGAGAAAAAGGPLLRLLGRLATAEPGALFWWGWALCPGLQTAYYTCFFASRSPIKVVYAAVIGLARTLVELSALVKCLQALLHRNRQAVVNSLLCCYLLPLIMTVQSLAVLLLLGVCFPPWIVHICVVAFCLWGPPVMVALMTTAWQPDRQRPLGAADAPAGFGAGGGALGAGAAGGLGAGRGAGQGAVAAVAGVWGRSPAPAHESKYWPPPVKVPEHLEDGVHPLPHYFVCPITHSVMAEPAVTSTGATYERAAILEWLQAQRRDPLTSRELHPHQISPNLALYRAIEEWVEAARRQLEARQQQQQQQEAQADADAACAATQLRRRDQRKKQQQQQRGAGRASLDAGRPPVDATQHPPQQPALQQPPLEPAQPQ